NCFLRILLPVGMKHVCSIFVLHTQEVNHDFGFVAAFSKLPGFPGRNLKDRRSGKSPVRNEQRSGLISLKRRYRNYGIRKTSTHEIFQHFIFYVESKKRRNSRHQFMTQLLNHLQRFWRTSRRVYYIVCRKTPVGGGYFISMLILLNVLHNGFRKNLKTFF